MEKAFKDAHTFASSETGAGLQEQDKGTFEEAVKKKCPYYYDLLGDERSGFFQTQGDLL